MRSSGYGYFYERRPHQYDDRHDILQQYIVSAPSLIKSFVSTVLEEPHKVHYYYGTLLSEYNKNRSSELFSNDDYPGLYFAAHHISFRTRGVVARDRQLREWGFHLALLVKKMLAPELKKGMALNDKKFLEILKRIDDNFDDAFRLASDLLRKLGLDAKQNRIGTVTERLVSEFGRQISQSKIATKSPRSDAELKLADGRYVGTLESVDSSRNRAVIKYGPFTVEGEAVDIEVLGLAAGARVPFAARNGLVQISAPKFDR